ncbi:hypothetical protein L211DRAFT_845154 [Terfezia boudieri ATCC MYA-4762]|uniref:Uncharacterized protein n=1 Tax=Terfezia boudieri ATCC MYA-4762 TaxID=1051890 RepID=A0A3N4M906_9PEZI|nr:hypothetical protein L211DRAFT_845154 [Terfezia boudieri ATCC MYA-4762]
MPRVGYKLVWLVQVTGTGRGLEAQDFQAILPIYLYDDWVWDWILHLCHIYTVVAIPRYLVPRAHAGRHDAPVWESGIAAWPCIYGFVSENADTKLTCQNLAIDFGA